MNKFKVVGAENIQFKLSWYYKEGACILDV